MFRHHPPLSFLDGTYSEPLVLLVGEESGFESLLESPFDSLVGVDGPELLPLLSEVDSLAGLRLSVIYHPEPLKIIPAG